MESKERNQNERCLTRMDLYGMAIGTVIGAGVMTMTGIGIGITGKSVNIAYMIAAVIALISAVPSILIGSTANFLGGQYSQIGILAGKRFAGIFIYLNIAMSLSLTMSSMSFAQYFLSMIPGVNERLISVGVITILCLLHTIAVKNAARLQNIMVVIVSLAIFAYLFFGLRNVQPGYFEGEDFMTGGVFGLIQTSFYLTMTLCGITYVANYSSKARNPVKDIPFVIVTATMGAAIVFMLMATVAAGVLPVDQVADKPLSVAAKVFMPGGSYVFFAAGGAMFALLTTLNGGLGSKVYPLVTASGDGWLPSVMARRNRRFGTPHWAFLAIFLLTVVPVAVGLDIAVVANSSVILATSIRILIAFSAMRLPKVMPELWEKSSYHLSDRKVVAICGMSMFLNGCSVVLLIFTKPASQIIGNLTLLCLATIVALVMEKRVTLKVSYEEM